MKYEDFLSIEIKIGDVVSIIANLENQVTTVAGEIQEISEESGILIGLSLLHKGISLPWGKVLGVDKLVPEIELQDAYDSGYEDGKRDEE